MYNISSTIMVRKVKKPPVFFTWLEVCHFMQRKSHSIPKQHHINMVQLRGCSAKAFAQYVSHLHHLSDDAMMLMFQDPSCREALELWSQNNRFAVSDAQIDALQSSLGLRWMLEHKFILKGKHAAHLLNTNQHDLLLNHLDHILFGFEEEALLLSKRNLPLTIAYLKEKKIISPQNYDLFLEYDAYDVYRAYFHYGQTSEDIRQKVIKTKSTEIFTLLCRYVKLSISEQLTLVDTGDIEKLRIYLKRALFQDKVVDYIAENASDAVFEFALKNGIFDAKPSETKYERLFRAENRALLLYFIQKFPLCTSTWEIKLLTSGDKELVDTYVKCHSLSSAATSYLLTHGFTGDFQISEQDLVFPDWETESYLFKYGSSEQIKACLSASEKLPELSALGEALLFKFAPVDILEEYILERDSAPSALAQKELILRNDSELTDFFLDCFDIKDELLPLFIHTADICLIMSYLIEHNQSGNASEKNIVQALCERGDKNLISYAVKNFPFGEHEETVLVQNAPQEYIQLYYAEKSLHPQAEAALLRSGNKQLIVGYISRYAVTAENEVHLVSLLDEEIIALYNAKHSFIGKTACEYLSL